MLRLESRSMRINKILTGVLIAILCLYIIPPLSLAAGFGTEVQPQNYYTWQLTYYAGVFSTAVTCSVNPSATMAILAVFAIFFFTIFTLPFIVSYFREFQCYSSVIKAFFDKCCYKSFQHINSYH